MKRKKLILSILVGVAVGSVAIYFLGTRSGKKEWARLKKTGSATANTFKTLGKELVRNVEQAQTEERNSELKALVKEALLT